MARSSFGQRAACVVGVLATCIAVFLGLNLRGEGRSDMEVRLAARGLPEKSSEIGHVEVSLVVLDGYGEPLSLVKVVGGLEEVVTGELGECVVVVERGSASELAISHNAWGAFRAAITGDTGVVQEIAFTRRSTVLVRGHSTVGFLRRAELVRDGLVFQVGEMSDGVSEPGWADSAVVRFSEVGPGLQAVRLWAGNEYIEREIDIARNGDDSTIELYLSDSSVIRSPPQRLSGCVSVGGIPAGSIEVAMSCRAEGAAAGPGGVLKTDNDGCFSTNEPFRLFVGETLLFKVEGCEPLEILLEGEVEEIHVMLNFVEVDLSKHLSLALVDSWGSAVIGASVSARSDSQWEACVEIGAGVYLLPEWASAISFAVPYLDSDGLRLKRTSLAVSAWGDSASRNIELKGTAVVLGCEFRPRVIKAMLRGGLSEVVLESEGGGVAVVVALESDPVELLGLSLVCNGIGLNSAVGTFQREYLDQGVWPLADRAVQRLLFNSSAHPGLQWFGVGDSRVDLSGYSLVGEDGLGKCAEVRVVDGRAVLLERMEAPDGTFCHGWIVGKGGALWVGDGADVLSGPTPVLSAGEFSFTGCVAGQVWPKGHSLVSIEWGGGVRYCATGNDGIFVVPLSEDKEVLPEQMHVRVLEGNVVLLKALVNVGVFEVLRVPVAR